MNQRQRATAESLKRRVIEKTCRGREADLTKAEFEHAASGVLFHLHAEVGIFHGTAIGWIGPRGGIHMTHERYDFY
jgi:hypothetical protein